MKQLFSTLAIAVIAVIAVLTLSACGEGTGTEDFNSTDVTFAQSMIPHHQQAVEMAKMAATRASSTEVKQLAAKIEAAQGPEIETMQGWLKNWGASEPDDSMTDGSMTGMMSDDDMTTLRKATGPEFDTMFLTMMIGHHDGAIEMANTEQVKGKNAEALAFARDIEDAQTSEIGEMKRILGR